MLYAPTPPLYAQEARALRLHLTALGHQKEGRYDEAQAAFEELLQSDFIHTACPVSPTHLGSYLSPFHRPAPHALFFPISQGVLDQVTLRLKYSSLKNLANMAATQGKKQMALQYYLQVTHPSPTRTPPPTTCPGSVEDCFPVCRHVSWTRVISHCFIA